jgi:tetratricopeptide (TPR) repeat protein
MGMLIGGGFWLVGQRPGSVAGWNARRAVPAEPAAGPGVPALPEVARRPNVAAPSSGGSAGGQTLITLIDRGVALARAGALAEAAAAFRQALAHEPRRADLWNNLGVVLVRAGELGAGVDPPPEAVTPAPGDAEAHRNLAVALDRRGQSAEAARHYRSFLDAASSDHPERAQVERRLAALRPRWGKS